MGEIEAITHSRGHGEPVHLRGSAYLCLSLVFIWIICNGLQILMLFRLAGSRAAAQ